jgi:uncharacterized membrane protein YdjX (TVP38/TMEM64 family)
VAAFAVAAIGEPRPHDLQALVRSAGVAGPLAFIGLYALLTVLLVPGSLGSAAAGALFGPVLGTLFTVVGATLGATLSFVIARRLGRERVKRIAGRRMERIDAWLARRGFLAVLYARLVPLFPFNALNYVAGVSGVAARDYVAATAIGIVPGSFAYVALGSSLRDPGSPGFVAALALVGALGALGPVLARATRKRRTGPQDALRRGERSRRRLQAASER